MFLNGHPCLPGIMFLNLYVESGREMPFKSEVDFCGDVEGEASRRSIYLRGKMSLEKGDE